MSLTTESNLWGLTLRLRQHKRLILAAIIGVVLLLPTFHLREPIKASVTSSWNGVVGSAPKRYASDGALVSRIPRDTIRENFKPGLKYAASTANAGWNNNVMSMFAFMHLLQLLRVHPTHPTAYVPLMMPFVPHIGHLDTEYAPTLPFGDVFDLVRLGESLGTPIVEWHEVKNASDCCYSGQMVHPDEGGKKAKDELSCWQMGTAVFDGGVSNRGFEQVFGMDVTWTPLPITIVDPHTWHPRMILFPRLLSFLLPSPTSLTRLHSYLSSGASSAPPLRSPSGDIVSPQSDFPFGPAVEGWRAPEGEGEGDVLCMDDLYFSSNDGVYPFSSTEEMEIGPWRTVGRFAHWNEGLKSVAVGMVRETLGLQPVEPLPTLITVHIRRTDFLPMCQRNRYDCMIVSQYAAHVEEIKERLRKEQGLEGGFGVVATSDETDPEYLKELKEAGIHVIDHRKLRTVERFNSWYPTIIDAVVLSLGKGFVGTGASTMTILSAERIKEWNGGVVTVTRLDEGKEKPPSEREQRSLAEGEDEEDWRRAWEMDRIMVF